MINWKELAKIDITETGIDLDGINWSLRQFSNPKSNIRIATTFSGIGAIEYAFKRLGLKHKIVFAGDIDKLRHIVARNFLQSFWMQSITRRIQYDVVRFLFNGI